MPGIGVIHNPHSRRNRRDPAHMHSMGYIVGRQGCSQATECVADLDQLLHEFAAQQIDILAINGGDGSNSLALTSMRQVWGTRPLPKIALLRGGTMNIAANSCGVRGTPAGLLMNLVHKVREGLEFETVWRDTLEMEGRIGFLWGNGFIQAFLDRLYSSGKKNVWAASKLLARGSLSALAGGPLSRELFSGVEARVTVDGEQLEPECFSALAAGTVEQIGLSFKAFHRAQERDGAFHLLAAVCSPARFALSLPKIYFGREVSQRKLLQRVASEVVIESARAVPYTLDGENYPGRERLVITTGPRLEIVVR